MEFEITSPSSAFLSPIGYLKYVGLRPSKVSIIYLSRKNEEVEKFGNQRDKILDFESPMYSSLSIWLEFGRDLTGMGLKKGEEKKKEMGLKEKRVEGDKKRRDGRKKEGKKKTKIA